MILFLSRSGHLDVRRASWYADPMPRLRRVLVKRGESLYVCQFRRSPIGLGAIAYCGACGKGHLNPEPNESCAICGARVYQVEYDGMLYAEPTLGSAEPRLIAGREPL